MKIQIYSERGYETWASWDVVYEWEDELTKRLEAEIVTVSKDSHYRKTFFKRVLHKLKLLKVSGIKYRLTGNDLQLAIIMNASSYYRYPMKNTIPIFLDFPEWMVQEIARVTQPLPCFFVTCYEIYNRLQKAGAHNVFYFPLSIADKYLIDVPPQKTIDVIQLGRKNAVLHEFMLRYVKTYPDVEYIYQLPGLKYESTKRGDIGTVDTREAYIKLLQSCRVSLISTPSVDRADQRFGGIDFITPRVYESAALYCRLIGRYTENEEARRIGMERVCPNAKSYEIFENAMNKALDDHEIDWTTQREFVQENLTSRRAEEICRVLSSCIQ